MKKLLLLLGSFLLSLTTYAAMNISKIDPPFWFTGMNNPELQLMVYGEGENLDMLKQASTLLLTTRRIPQLYYGTEVMMNGVKSKSDGYVRKDFPGGWADDKENALTPEGRTRLQNESYNFYRNLLNWRKGNDVIAKGSMKQFMVQHGVYAYARQYKGKTVFVLLNGTDKEVKLPLKYYAEVLKDKTQGKDVISGKVTALNEELTMAPRQSMVIEL